jgi:Ca2+-binding RTX toxin-like protein
MGIWFWDKKWIANCMLLGIAGAILLSIVLIGDRYASGSIIIGTKGDDFLVGDPEVNTIRALAGDDQIHGGPARDKIYSEKGDDYVVGNEGNDMIIGGKDIETSAR